MDTEYIDLINQSNIYSNWYFYYGDVKIISSESL